MLTWKMEMETNCRWMKEVRKMMCFENWEEQKNAARVDGDGFHAKRPGQAQPRHPSRACNRKHGL